MDTIFLQEIGEVKDFLGHRCAQVFVGMKSKYIFIILLHKEAEGPGTLQDFFHYVGAPSRLHYDQFKMHLSARIKKNCQDAYVLQPNTKANHPWQNLAECCIQELKKVAEFYMMCNYAPMQA